MPRLDPDAARNAADNAVWEAMSIIEQHLDAHPLRYGRVSDAAHEEMRERVEHGFRKTISELEVPPK